MKKITVIASSLSIIVLSLSTAYYFLFFLPNIKRQELTLKNDTYLSNKQIECQKNGMEIYKNDMSDIKSPFNPMFKYNGKLKTCLYKGGWFETSEVGGTMFTGFIKDIYTNKEIISYMTITKDGKTDELLSGVYVSQKEFEATAKELFEE